MTICMVNRDKLACFKQPYSTSNPIVRRPTLWCRNGVRALAYALVRSRACAYLGVVDMRPMHGGLPLRMSGGRVGSSSLRLHSKRGALLAFSRYGLARARAFACVALALPHSDVASPCRRRHVALTSPSVFAGS